MWREKKQFKKKSINHLKPKIFYTINSNGEENRIGLEIPMSSNMDLLQPSVSLCQQYVDRFVGLEKARLQQKRRNKNHRKQNIHTPPSI